MTTRRPEMDADVARRLPMAAIHAHSMPGGRITVTLTDFHSTDSEDLDVTADGEVYGAAPGWSQDELRRWLLKDYTKVLRLRRFAAARLWIAEVRTHDGEARWVIGELDGGRALYIYTADQLMVAISSLPLPHTQADAVICYIARSVHSDAQVADTLAWWVAGRPMHRPIFMS